MWKPERCESGWKSCVAQYEPIELQNAEYSLQSTPAMPMPMPMPARRARRLHLKRTTNLSQPFSDGAWVALHCFRWIN